MEGGSKVQVAVRLRPMNKRELDIGTKCVVDMDNNQTVLYHPDAPFGEPPKKGSHVKHQPKSFAFDNCFWSMDESNKKKFEGQDKVFDSVGRSLLKNAFSGYNACIFAYGQTGSGKSYTMMGTLDQKGIIPQLCDSLFEKITEDEGSDEQSHTVEVSYMEIYNEKVHDLLAPASTGNLKVREHKILGPYVDGLSLLAVNCYQDIESLMVEGNKSRTVAATNMNSESSRSHAVFTIKLTQTLSDKASGVSGERVSKMSLVDLAGSERVTKTGAMGERLKEGSNINKSLTTLGLVIKALAESSSSSAKSKKGFVPYRDSVLTWLLKDNLGGNSKTVMIATVSPAADNYEETLSTLRYADSAKRIVNHAVVNEDPNARIVRELRTEVETLRQQLVAAESMKAPDLQEKLQESEKLIEEMSKTWEEKLQETERIHQERHAALESMGVSVETSGIKVDSEKCYLVNLNADPSLNELLVYYLKDVTLVGSGDESASQDIQLQGLGISTHHCTINIENDREVHVTPQEGARTCVNGSRIDCKTRIRHGDRILWGNNHFFRLNIPRRENSMMTSSTELAEELHVDYDFAQQEIMQQAHDPIQESIEAIEKQYENDKQAALEAQKQMYEEQMLMLKTQITSGAGSSPVPWNHYLAGSHSSSNVNDRLQRRIQQMAQERNSKFKQGLSKLKEDLMRVNMYAREANELAQELRVDAQYSVTLQIPSSNLSPNRRRGALMSEPAILARNSDDKTEVFSMEDFESKLVSMREIYQEHKVQGPLGNISPNTEGPFLINAANHDLIGVANVFLDALFYDVKLDYYVAIINQQGEVSGRLHVELCKLDGSLNDSYNDPEDVSSLSSDDSNNTNNREITLKVCIKDAKGLPPALSNFVFCQYTFWGESEAIVVAPIVDESFSEESSDSGTVSCKFNHEKEFTVAITEEFVEHLYDGALSIEVYGHPSDEGRTLIGRSLADRWSEMTRKLEIAVEIQELDDQGLYVPVEVQVKPDVYCGGVFQLRQGFSRRIVVKARPIATSGSLPLTVDSITGLSVGGLCVRSLTHKGLDSYQEDGLTLLRSRWNEALEKRKQYLDDKMQLLAAKQEKTETDLDREKNLMTQWLALADERNNVLVPQPGSGVPGAPATGDPEFGLEHHCPVIYLDLNIEDMTPRHPDDDVPVAELAILDKEMNTTFLPLPVVHTDNNVASCIVTSWDSSIHDSIHLNRVTPPNERIYMIVKAYITLSHPAPIEITLRKRICVNVYKHQSLTMKLRKKISKTANAMGATHNAVGRLLHTQENLTTCGIMYDIVSSIPKASEELEDRETMAKLAASGYETQDSADGESYIEKYIKSVAAVESIITLDRLGQEVAIKDSLLASGRTPKRTFSSPNINAVLDIMYGSLRAGAEMMKTSSSTPSFTDKMRSPLVRLSESFQDLSRHVMKPSNSANSPLAAASSPQNNTNSLDDNSLPGSITKPKLAGGEFGSDTSAAADEGYGSTPRRAAASRSPKSSDDNIVDSKSSEDSRKTLDFDNIQTSEEPIELAETLAQKSTEHSSEVIDNTFQTNYNSTTTSQYSDEKQTLYESASENTQSDVSSNQTSQSAEQDPDATPTRQNNSQLDDSASTQLHKVSAPLASIESDAGTPDITPKHCTEENIAANPEPGDEEEEDILNVTNELQIVEDGDIDQNSSKKPSPSAGGEMVESGVVLTSDRGDDIDDDLDSYNEDGGENMNGATKTRADMLSDIYSMNALDELEALGDSMESLNSCCSTDEGVDQIQVQPSTAATNVAVSTPRSTRTAAPLLVSSDSDGESGDEAVSTCSFGSTADLSAVSSTPVPSWCEIGVPVIVLSTKGDSPEKGYIRYVGETEFALGAWVGVQLDNMKGKNNGTVKGTSYFPCKASHGVFVRHDRLLLDKKRSNKTFPAHKVVINRSPANPPAQKPSASSTPSYLKPTRASRVRKS